MRSNRPAPGTIRSAVATLSLMVAIAALAADWLVLSVCCLLVTVVLGVSAIASMERGNRKNKDIGWIRLATWWKSLH